MIVVSLPGYRTTNLNCTTLPDCMRKDTEIQRDRDAYYQSEVHQVIRETIAKLKVATIILLTIPRFAVLSLYCIYSRYLVSTLNT